MQINNKNLHINILIDTNISQFTATIVNLNYYLAISTKKAEINPLYLFFNICYCIFNGGGNKFRTKFTVRAGCYKHRLIMPNMV